NYATSAAGSIRWEIQNAEGSAFPGYSLDNSDEIFGDETCRTVSWKGQTDISSLAGQAIRLRCAMKDADIFSIRFSE
ncbi:MAG: hypothetical protein QF886_23805, partial [Planctomycetota bacterium]|nr:hypothetical protein [Planctomycetota bacterium]